MITGSTRLTLMIGHPIAQVSSPAMFNERFSVTSRDAVMVPVDLLPDQLDDFFHALRGWQNADGCVVTMPYKRAIVRHLDDLTTRATRLEAANVVRRTPDGRLKGDNLDGCGFLEAARRHAFRPEGRSALVIGCGGAGSAIVDALCEGGLRELVMTDVDDDRVSRLSRLVRSTFPDVDITISTGDDLGRFDLIVNASPIGMDGRSLPISKDAIATIRHEALVADVVTAPAMTAFLRCATSGGCTVQTGPEMAAGQTELLGRFIGCLP